jgi:putative acyl-CoA dehydrogenase
VAALDVLRAMVKEPAGLPAFMAECELAAGADARLDAHLDHVRVQAKAVFATGEPQFHARRVVEDLAVALQASLLVRHSPSALADAFCASRLAGDGGRVYGTLPAPVDAGAIIDRAYPA